MRLLKYVKLQSMNPFAVILKLVIATRCSARPVRRRGQTLVEYAIVLAMISILAVGVFAALGDRIALIFSAIDNILDTAQGT